MSSYNVNALAARALMRVFSGQTLESALLRYRDHDVGSEIANLCYETMRHYYSLSERLQNHASRPVEKLDREIWCLLLVGACQIEYTRTPRYAAVSGAVDATRKLGKGSASSFVNAVLRNYDAASELQTEDAHAEMPAWLATKVRKHYPDQAQVVLDTCNSRAPMTLRINTRKVDMEQYCALLEKEGIDYSRCVSPSGITLARPQPMAKLPGYAENLFAVQDSSSQLAVPLLDAESSHRILDACASPGQKTRQILDSYPGNFLLSVDRRKKETATVEPSNGLQSRTAQFIEGDVTNLSWFDGVPFQRILLDAPCSGTGTLRRHPDIKVFRTETQIHEMTHMQLQMLQSLWRALSVGGLLVYCTCSILPEENDEIVRKFVSDRHDVSVLKTQLPSGFRTNFGWQILPEQGGGDGFYFARLAKVN